MLFNSLQFLLFLPLVVVVYFITPFRYRWGWLLAASYYFYMSWKLEYGILLLLATTITYTMARLMAGTTHPAQRKLFLTISIATSLGLLFLFKYFNFFNESLRALFNQVSIGYMMPNLELLLPVGISFYTFQTISYTLDVYNRRQPPETHFGIFALYVAFFPQLAAGPITRAHMLLPQFHQKQPLDSQRIGAGLRLILWGFFKKIVIADRLAVYVATVYNNPDAYHGLPIIVATYFFAFQIYCDFSAYSDIAIGTARLLGYDLMRNFRQPYFATSIPDFWRRWHISLSTWFRDYLYIPLGGNRVAPWRLYLNLLIVFVVSGLWHGANWTFVIWGALHGFYSALAVYGSRWWPQTNALRAGQESAFQPFSWGKLGQILLTFHLVLFAWIFFRANSIGDAFTLIGNATQLAPLNLGSIVLINPNQWLIALGAIGILLAVDFWHAHVGVAQAMARQPIWLRWGICYLVLIAILAFGEYRAQDFIYSQF